MLLKKSLLLMIDTETTGIPSRHGAGVRPVQIGALAMDRETGEEVSSFKLPLCPDVWVEGYEGAEKVHKLSRPWLEQNGYGMVAGWEKFTAWIKQVLRQGQDMDDDAMRHVLANMRLDVAATDARQAASGAEAELLKTALDDCDELVSHILGVAPQAFERLSESLFVLMPRRYFVGKQSDSTEVMLLNITVQCLFLFAIQARHLMQTESGLTALDLEDLKAWSVDGVLGLSLPHLSAQASDEIAQDALISARYFLAQI